MHIYKANVLYTPTQKAFEIIENGYVVVSDDGWIEDVFSHLPETYRNCPMTDFGDALLIPAMNDLHVHAAQYRNMGIAMDMELLPWLNTYTFPEEALYQDQAYATRIYQRFVHELWRWGTMRASVFATIHIEATLCLMDIFHKAGMGAYVGLVGMDRNCPGNLRNTDEEVMIGTKKMLTYSKDYPLVKPILTPRFIPTCTPNMLRSMGEMAAKERLPIQSHLSENRSEITWVRELEPKSSCYGDAYYRYGLFGQTPTLMAHCCYSEGEEVELMRGNQVMVVHCPTSNCNLGSGIAPIRTFLQKNIPVALGSDMSGGHHLSIFRVMQYALQMSKLQYAHTEGQLPFLSLAEVFYMATKSGGSFFGKVGSFEKGYAFDALVVDDGDLNDLYRPYNLIHRLERYIYLGDDRQITHRFCQGREIKVFELYG